jgi:hypothetical protein
MSFSGQWKIPGCCPYKQPNVPQNPTNLIRLVLYGTIYTEMPVFFSEQGEMINLQFYADINRLTYTWVFYKPDDVSICDMNIVLITSEDIMPNIFEEITNTTMKVQRLRRWNGRTKWLLSC